jgi:hypothetical protein
MKKEIDDIKAIIVSDEFDMELLPPVTADELQDYEQRNSISLPSKYKEWLVYSDGGRLFNASIQLYGIKSFPKIEINSSGIPTNYIVIGMLGFGEAICFIDGGEKIYQYGETIIEYANFKELLRYAIDNFGVN